VGSFGSYSIHIIYVGSFVYPAKMTWDLLFTLSTWCGTFCPSCQK